MRGSIRRGCICRVATARGAAPRAPSPMPTLSVVGGHARAGSRRFFGAVLGGRDRYLIRLQKGLDSDTKSVQINLVKDCLNIEISLKDFLQLCNGVETALINKFGYKTKIQN